MQAGKGNPVTMNTCRTCLETRAEKDVSDLEKGLRKTNKNYFEIMLFCLDIKVSQNSEITTKLCKKCYSKIVSFYKFKALSLKNDEHLKSQNLGIQSEDQKLSIYVDEKVIKHENLLEADEFGASLVEESLIQIKVESDLKDEEETLTVYEEIDVNYNDTLGNDKINIKCDNTNDEIDVKYDGVNDTFESVESDGEPPTCEQKVIYENITDNTTEKGSEQTKDKTEVQIQCKACPKVFRSIGGRNRHYKTKHLGKKSKCHICGKEVVCLSVHMLRKHNPGAMRFCCTLCERRFPSQAVLDLHVVTHTRDFAFECDICQKKFSCKGFLTKHIRQVHNKERNHKCPHCSKAFFLKNKLKDHLRTHSASEGTTKQVCEECGKSVANLKEHSRLHQPRESRLRVPCRACPKLFISKSGRNKHYRVTHLGRRGKCDVCGKEVVDLTHHKLRKHRPEALRFPCTECERRCVSQADLHAHMTTHTRDYKFQCDVCQKQFSTNFFVQQHKDYKFQCDVCQKQFSTNFFVQQHKRMVHNKEKRFHCDQCPMAFFNKDKLIVHIRCHTNERPYRCGECGLSFRTTSTLARHLAVHSDVKKFYCEVCGASFKFNGNLRAHMISHTKEKRHGCRFCGARFGRTDHRNRHELTAHKQHGEVVKAEPDAAPS